MAPPMLSRFFLSSSTSASCWRISLTSASPSAMRLAISGKCSFNNSNLASLDSSSDVVLTTPQSLSLHCSSWHRPLKASLTPNFTPRLRARMEPMSTAAGGSGTSSTNELTPRASKAFLVSVLTKSPSRTPRGSGRRGLLGTCQVLGDA